MKHAARWNTALHCLLWLCLYCVSAPLLAANFTVTSASDSGTGTLRQVMTQAMASAGSHTILFAPALDGTPIVLASPLPPIPSNITLIITGQGPTNTIIDGNHQHRPFSSAWTTNMHLTLRDLTIRNGRAQALNGGAIDLEGGTASSLTVERVEFLDNYARYEGGAIRTQVPTRIENSLFVGNRADTFGSGISAGSAPLLVRNSSFTGNTSSVSVIQLDGNIEPAINGRLVNVTVTGNTTYFSTIQASWGARLSMSNSIVAGNTVTESGSLGYAEGGAIIASESRNNIIGPTPGPGPGLDDGVNGNQLDVTNPLVGPLGNYGGTTRTLPLLPGSPAINAGTTAGGDIPNVDQRGISRVGTTDIGAFESRGFTLSQISGNNQSTPIGSAFSAPLIVEVTANQAVEPVAGGQVMFSAPASGASATFSANPHTLDSDGRTQASATANTTAGGPYNVTAALANGGNPPAPVTFALTNTALPQLSVNDVSLNEGNSGSTVFTFTVSLNQPAGAGGVTFDIATANGTAVAPGDYSARSLTGQTIPAGSSSYAFAVQVNGDTDVEANETFFVNVTNVTNATVLDGQGIGTIVNDDVDPCAGFSFPYALAGTNNTARVAELRQAIDCANANATYDLIDLAGHTLVFIDAPYGSTSNHNALPPIASHIRMQNGRLERDPAAADQFRFLAVDATGELIVLDMSFSGGNSMAGGGAINATGPLLLSGALFEDNLTTNSGGGAVAGQRLVVIGSRFSNNRSNLGGDAIWAGRQAPSSTEPVVILNSHFEDHGDAAEPGTRVIIISTSGQKRLENLLFARNTVDGGLIGVTQATTVSNLTFADNDLSAGPLLWGPLTVHNGIVWGNQLTTLGTSAVFNHSLVQGGFPTGTGNIDLDPRFTDAANGDYTLASGSPAIDAGDNAVVGPDTFDLDGDADITEDLPDLAGNPRRHDDAGVLDTGLGTAPVVDMGAYERQTDSGAPGVMITPTSGLVTTEAGGSATFTVVLDTQPNADVSIALSSSDTTEGTVAPASVSFTAVNWNVAQTVTVTGVDDNEVDGDISYSIVTAAAISADVNYSGIDPADVSVTNTDNDTAGISVTPTSGLVTTEGMGPTGTPGVDQFSVVLTSQPVADVTIALSSSDTTEGTVSPASLTFTPANWNTAQHVDVLSVDDTIVDGDIAYSIVTAPAVSADVNYNGIDPADVSVTNIDNDSAGVTVNPSSGLVTTEAGGTASFTVALNTQPSAEVSISLSSSDTTEGTVAPASVIFTTANWNIAQTVTVTGVDDSEVDGDITYSIVTGAAISADVNYNGINPADVSVTNIDNDSAGIMVNPTSGLVTSEAGGTASFTVALNTQPSAEVSIALSSSDTTEGTVVPANLTFTAANWNIAQTVTVTGVDDSEVDGDITYSIITAAAVSADANYNGIDPVDVSVTNTDNDSAGIMVNPTSGLVTTEAGGTASFTVALNTQPSAEVSIALSSSDTTEGTVAPASVIFTTANWNIPQAVTVTGVGDNEVDGDITYSIVTAAAISADANYNGIDPADVLVTNTDDEVAGAEVFAYKSVQQPGTSSQPVIYEIALANLGDDDQPDDPGSDELVDILPPQLALTSASATSGTVSFDPASNTVRWNGVLIAGAAPVLIQIEADVLITQPALISNQAAVHYDSNGDGANDTTRLSTDPALAGEGEPTVFPFVGTATGDAPRILPVNDPRGLLGLILLMTLAAGGVLMRRRV